MTHAQLLQHHSEDRAPQHLSKNFAKSGRFEL